MESRGLREKRNEGGGGILKNRKNGEVTYPQNRGLRFIWQKPDKNRSSSEQQRYSGVLHWPVLLLPSFYSVFLCLSSSPSLSLCVHIETSILETGEREAEFGRLPISSSPWRPWDQASKEGTHTHTLLPATEGNSLALCYTENPTFPQSDRQVDSWVLHQILSPMCSS